MRQSHLYLAIKEAKEEKNYSVEVSCAILGVSRTVKCIDSGPMEGFRGILKRERYYGRRFTTRGKLVSMIENYITYYKNRRVQCNPGVLTPMEKHYSYPLAARKTSGNPKQITGSAK